MRVAFEELTEVLEDAAKELRDEQLMSDIDLEYAIRCVREVRVRTARVLRRAAEQRLARPSAMDVLREDLVGRMRGILLGVVPSEFLQVRGFGRTHEVLLEYLMAHVDRGVPGSTLRLISGDQVHAERRVRDLRKLGLTIEAHAENGESAYCLSSDRTGLDEAACAIVLDNLQSHNTYGCRERDHFAEAVREARARYRVSKGVTGA